MADAETLRLLALQSLHRSKADADEPEEGEIRDEPPQQPAKGGADPQLFARAAPAAAAAASRAPAALVPSFAAAGRPASAPGSFIITFDEDEADGHAPPLAPPKKPAELQSEIERMRSAIARQEQARLANGLPPKAAVVAPPAKRGPKPSVPAKWSQPAKPPPMVVKPPVKKVKPSPKKAAAASAAKAPPFSVQPSDTFNGGLPRDKTGLLTAAASADDFLKAMAAGVAPGAEPSAPAAKPLLLPMKRAFPAAASAHDDSDKRMRLDAAPPRGTKQPLVVHLKPPAPPPAASAPSQAVVPAATAAASPAPAQKPRAQQPRRGAAALDAQQLLQLAQHDLDDAEIAEQRLLVRLSLAPRSTPEMLAELADAAARRAAAAAKAAALAVLALRRAGAGAPAEAVAQHAAPALPPAFSQSESELVAEFRRRRRAELRSLALACAPALAPSHPEPLSADAPAAAHGGQSGGAERGTTREQERTPQANRQSRRGSRGGGGEKQRRSGEHDGARELEDASPRQAPKIADRQANQPHARGEKRLDRDAADAARSPGAGGAGGGVAKVVKQPQQRLPPPPARSRAAAPAGESSLVADAASRDSAAVALPAAPAPAALPAHPPLLFAATSITALLQCASSAEPSRAGKQPVVAEASSAGDYESPLLALRSVRALPQFSGAWRLDTSCPTFSHSVDPLWPLCPFDLRGECRDASCPWQSREDTTISASELVSDLVSIGAVPSHFQSRGGGNAAGVSPGQLSLAPLKVPRERRRPTRPPVAELLVPAFVRAHGAAGPLRTAVFRTALLAPAAAFAAQPAATDEAYEERTLAADARVGRYHSFPEEDAVPRASIMESRLLEDPTDVPGWLHLGLSKIGFSFDNAAQATADSALTVLARGLEVNSGSSAMWVAYLQIFSRRFTLAESRDMAEHALKYVPASPLLWRVVVGLQDEPQGAAAVARRAVVALSAAVSAAAPGPAAATARAAALDAALNALRLACDFENGAELASWAAALVTETQSGAADQEARDAMQHSASDAVASLLLVLSNLQAAVLMSAAAEAVAWRRLPILTSAASGCVHPDVLPALRWPSSAAATSSDDDMPLRLLRCAFSRASRDGARAAAAAAENYLCALAARQGAAAALAELPELRAALPPGAPLAPLLRCTFALVGAVEDRDAGLERAKVLLTTASVDTDLSEARIDLLAILARTRGLDEAASLAARWVDAHGSAPDTAWSLLMSAFSAVCSKDIAAAVSLFERALDISQPSAETSADDPAVAAHERVFLEYLALVAQCVELEPSVMQPSALAALLSRRAREAVATLPAPVERFDSLRDARVRALLEPRMPTYTAALAGAAAAALRSLPLDAMTDVAEAALDASPGAVPVALEAARRASATEPAQARTAAVAWAAPLLAAALVAAAPSPPPHLWAEAIRLCSDAPDAAHELSCAAFASVPRSLRRAMRSACLLSCADCFKVAECYSEPATGATGVAALALAFRC